MKNIILLVSVFVIIAFLTTSYQLPTTNYFGVTFSPMYAKYLSLDWQETYLAILDELKVKRFRIPTYWSEVEKTEGKLDFSEVDFMVDQAGQRGAKLILVVGIKQPRWPECHVPQWAKNLPVEGKQQKALTYIEKVIQRYQDKSQVIAWQVENEPYHNFGDCDKYSANFLKKEVDLVKNLDSKRPIIITDSGEFSLWLKSSKFADQLGISLYRKVHNPYLGNITYPLPSWIYPARAKLIGEKVFITELQAEPWLKLGAKDTDIEEQTKLFSLSDFKNNLNYAKRTGLNEMYLWGVEWWYFMAKNGHPEYLDYAKSLF